MSIFAKTKPSHKSVKGKNSNFFYCDCKKRYSTKQKLTTHLGIYK